MTETNEKQKQETNRTKGTKTSYVKLNSDVLKKAAQYVQMVGTGDILGCILIGDAGMGKTELVRHTLEEMGVEYVLSGGHITLAAAYVYLYQNRDQVIFFDDVSQVINKVEIMEVLKQALNSGGRKRMLSYRSTGVLPPEVPEEFEFTGRIIFSFNHMDKNNPNVKAIIDRVPKVEMNFNRKDVIDMMYQIAEKDMSAGGLLEHERMIVTKEIEDFTDHTMDISLRKQNSAFKTYSAMKKLHGDGNDVWKPLVQDLFGKKIVSWVKKMVIDMVGEGGKIPRKELAKQIAMEKGVDFRTANRRINMFLELEEIYADKERFSNISTKPFGKQ